MSGTLYLVATPIGNLGDITFRAVETLKSVDVVACEDTRHTRKLLNHFSISAKTVSYHEHNENVRADELIAQLLQGKNVAVVSDAGTPAVCDPAFRIVEKAIEHGVRVESIPGAVAFVNAVIISGLPTDSVVFGGFLPSKSGERKKRLEELRPIPATICVYEAPHRIAKTLADCSEILGNRKAAVVRELTKLHETVHRGTLAELKKEFAENAAKGEIVLVVDRANENDVQVKSDITLAERHAELLAQGIDRKIALKAVAKEFGVGKSEAYRQVQK